MGRMVSAYARAFECVCVCVCVCESVFCRRHFADL